MARKLGAYTACLHDRPLGAALDVLAANGLTSVEVPGTGVYMDVLDYQWDVAAEF